MAEQSLFDTLEKPGQTLLGSGFDKKYKNLVMLMGIKY